MKRIKVAGPDAAGDVALRNWARACVLDRTPEGVNAKQYLPADYHRRKCGLSGPRRPLPR